MGQRIEGMEQRVEAMEQRVEALKQRLVCHRSVEISDGLTCAQCLTADKKVKNHVQKIVSRANILHSMRTEVRGLGGYMSKIEPTQQSSNNADTDDFTAELNQYLSEGK